MSVRINPDVTSGLLSALANIRQAEETALDQLASGRRLRFPSQDPASLTVLLQNHEQAAKVDQYSRNADGIRPLLQMGDSSMNSVVLALTRAVSLGIEGANGTQSPENRKTIAGELRGVRAQLLSVANATFNGWYIFAGTAVETQPFVEDGLEAAGVRYQGNANTNEVEVAQANRVGTGLAGDRLFTSPDGNVFLGLNHLISALETGEGIKDAVAEVQRSLDHVNSERTFFGAGLNRLDAADEALSRDKFELSRQENLLAASDIPTTVMNLARAQAAREAALAAGAKMSQLSLLDYLR